MTDRRPLQRFLAWTLVIGPVLIFLGLRLSPTRDAMWDLPIFHFYIVSYTSLVALVVASFVLAGVGVEGSRQAMLVAMAFVSMAAIFFIHGISTPGVLIPGFNQAVGWSARLSLSVGAGFIALGMRDLPSESERDVLAHPQRLWLVLAVAYVAYIGLVYGLPGPLERLAQSAVVSAGLALVTAGLFVWGAWRAWTFYRQEPRRLTLALGLALPWLALAQISQYAAPLWAASWWMYHVLMLAAFVITMAALVMDYEQILDFRIVRYFTALGVVIGVPIVVLLGEAAVRVAGVEAVRWPMSGIAGVLLTGLFLALLIVVRRAGRILDERAAALEAEKQWRADFTNLIVHDLKAPLTVIHTGLGIVMSGQAGEVSDRLRDRLDRVRRGGQEMLSLIDNLLDVERLEAGALRLMPEEVDLVRLLHGSANHMAELAEAYDIDIKVILPFNLPPIQADRALLQRVLQNLLSNALKFTPRSGRIQVEAMPTSKEVTISVTDTGPGVPPAQREHIFNKFVQVQGIERRGAGLGLAFCKLAVEAHGGRIWVEDGPEGGSRFAFSLPTGPVRR